MKVALLTKKDLSLGVIIFIWISVIVFVVTCTLFSSVNGSVTGISATQRKIPVYSVDTKEKTIALTFNCAWDDKGLDELLKILQEENIRCTFFFVGEFAEEYPEAVRKICNGSHEIGNHSMYHKDPTKQEYDEILSDINKCNELLYSITGKAVSLYRAPSGAYDNKTLEAAESLGMSVIQWDVDSIDWKDPLPEKIISRVTKRVTDGSVVLFHLGKENTLSALPDIISALKKEGYSFSTVGDMLLKGDTYTDNSGRQHLK